MIPFFGRVILVASVLTHVGQQQVVLAHNSQKPTILKHLRFLLGFSSKSVNGSPPIKTRWFYKKTNCGGLNGPIVIFYKGKVSECIWVVPDIYPSDIMIYVLGPKDMTQSRTIFAKTDLTE